MASLDFCMFCGCSIAGAYCPYCKEEQVSSCCEREGCKGTPSRGETICDECWDSYYTRDIPGFGDDPNRCNLCDATGISCTCEPYESIYARFEDPTEGYEKEIDRGGEGLDPDDCLYGDMD